MIPTITDNSNHVRSEKKWVSPTYAKTTDNPPYANYPKLSEKLISTTLITNSYMQQTEREPGKFLHKKCYYGNTLHDMPWIKSNIDLSFPEIKKV